MYQGLVQIRDAGKPAHGPALHFGEQDQIRVGDAGERPEQGFHLGAEPGTVVWQMSQRLVQQQVDRIHLLLQPLQVGGADPHPAPASDAFGQPCQPLTRRAVVAQVGGKGQIVRSGRLEAETLHELPVVRRCVAAEDDRRPVPSLDQHPVAVLGVQVEGTSEGVETPLPCPARHALQQAFGDPDVFEVLEKTEHAFPAIALYIDDPVLGGADRARHSSVLPGGEQLRLAVLEERSAPGVDRPCPFWKQRRNPERIVAVDLPGKGEEAAPVDPGADPADFDSAHRPAASPAALRTSSSLTI